MKCFVFMFSCILTTSVFAIDDSVFLENYPSIQDYQRVCLQGLKNYFTTLSDRSIAVRGSDGLYQYKFMDDFGNITTEIRIKIERIRSNGSLTENVSFIIMPNFVHLDYILKRSGSNIVDTPDIDLLNFNLSSLKGDYDLLFPQFNTRFQKIKADADVEKSNIIMGQFAVNISIETIVKDALAYRNYVYFTREVDDAHAVLTVRAILDDGDNKTTKFIHLSKGAEISPKYFFEGLEEGAQLFPLFSTISLQLIKQMGFPAITGIN